jgi:formate dehydrogenase alpha subunit
MIQLTIDGKTVEAEEGKTVLEAAQQGNIYIPTLCSHPDLPPYGACRMCIVEIDGVRGYPPSCTTPASNGMVVKTDTPVIKQLRLDVLELILSQHPHSCLICEKRVECDENKESRERIRKVGITTGCKFCPKDRQCELQEVVDRLGLKEINLPIHYKGFLVEKSDPFYDRDYNLCILCGRCVRVCQEIRGAGTLSLTYRGPQAIVGTAYNRNLIEAGCHFCGSCVTVCPTGALAERISKWDGPPDHSLVTTCSYCGIGCQLQYLIKDGRIIKSLPEADPLVNKGQACAKGRFSVVEFVYHRGRLTSPMIKKDGELIKAGWDDALDFAADNLAKYRGDQFALLSSPHCTNEDNYIAQKFTRLFMRTNNIDTSGRYLYGNSLLGITPLLLEARPISDIRNAAGILSLGMATVLIYSIIVPEVKKAVDQGATLITAETQENNLDCFSSSNLLPRTGSELELITGMARIIIDMGWFIESNWKDFVPFTESLKDFDLDYCEKITGIPRNKLTDAARVIATQKPSVIILGPSIGQYTNGIKIMQAIANLIGLTGAGIIPFLAQNNAWGAWYMGSLPDMYPGFLSATDPDARKKIENLWGQSMPAHLGLEVAEILQGSRTNNKLKCLYLIDRDPFLNISKPEFLIAHDIFLSSNNKDADVIFPSVNLAEAEGTYINMEGRIQRARKAIEPPGQSKPDWWIICELAKRLQGKGFDYKDSSAITEEISHLIPDFSSHDRFERKRLVLPDMEKRFVPIEYKAPEMPDKEYPFTLTIEYGLHSFRNTALSSKVGGMKALSDEGEVRMNIDDAVNLGISGGEKIRITGRHGEITACAKLTRGVPRGMALYTRRYQNGLVRFDTNPCTVKIGKL